MSDRNRKTRRWLGRAALAGSCLLVLFWTLYFTDMIRSGEEAASLFESAFPLADALLMLILMAAGIGLLRGKPYGTFCLVGSAAMALYLGLLDLTFYARQGLFTATGDGVFQALVTLCCLAGGGLGLRFGWKMWAEP